MLKKKIPMIMPITTTFINLVLVTKTPLIIIVVTTNIISLLLILIFGSCTAKIVGEKIQFLGCSLTIVLISPWLATIGKKNESLALTKKRKLISL